MSTKKIMDTKTRRVIIAGCIGIAIFSGVGFKNVLDKKNEEISQQNKQIKIYEEKISRYQDIISEYQDKISKHDEFFKSIVCEKIDEIAPQYRIPTDYAKGLIYALSGFDPTANDTVSRQVGVAQLNKQFAQDRELIVNDKIDERTNIDKSLHVAFSQLNTLRTFIEANTDDNSDKDNLNAAVSMMYFYGCRGNISSIKDGHVPKYLTNNRYVKEITDRAKMFS